MKLLQTALLALWIFDVNSVEVRQSDQPTQSYARSYLSRKLQDSHKSLQSIRKNRSALANLMALYVV